MKLIMMMMLMTLLIMMQVESPILDYKHQVEALTAAGFALWDVVQNHIIAKILSSNHKTQKNDFLNKITKFT